MAHSMANLQRLGLVEAHEKLVYVWDSLTLPSIDRPL